MTGKIFGIPLVVIVLILSIVGINVIVLALFNDALHKRIDILQSQNSAMQSGIAEIEDLRKKDLCEMVMPSDAINEETSKEDVKPVVKPKVTQPVQNTSSDNK